ncbi:MAG: hypothetical protein BMS9Abin37_0038 [Acidobacteriota bacterium]|nr:MAG: hypothetical protein BMS9Abin37_0038 [Acidobacteriota bacterium]
MTPTTKNSWPRIRSVGIKPPKDIRNELEELKQDVDSGAALAPSVQKAARSWRGMFLGTGVLVVYFTWRDDVGDIWVMDVAQQ